MMELVIKSHCARPERSCYKFKTVSSHLISSDFWQFGVWFIDHLAVCYISNSLLICTVDMIDSFCWATFRTILTQLKLGLVWESDVHQNRDCAVLYRIPQTSFLNMRISWAACRPHCSRRHRQTTIFRRWWSLPPWVCMYIWGWLWGSVPYVWQYTWN